MLYSIHLIGRELLYLYWARGKSRGQSPRDFPRAQAIFHRVSQLKSQYNYFQLPNGFAAADTKAVVTAAAANVHRAIAVQEKSSTRETLNLLTDADQYISF